MARAKPSAEQSSSPPCRSSLGAKAIEWMMLSNRPQRRSNLVEHGLQLPGRFDVEWGGDGRAEALGQRLDMGSRLVIQPGDREFRARLAKGFRATVGNGMVVGDANHQALVARQDRPDFRHIDRISHVTSHHCPSALVGLTPGFGRAEFSGRDANSLSIFASRF